MGVGLELGSEARVVDHGVFVGAQDVPECSRGGGDIISTQEAGYL